MDRNEIASLRKMTAKQLRQKHLELFGEECRSGNRQWLFRRLAWRMQALAEGGLTERARKRAQELARDTDIRIRPPAGMVMAPASGRPMVSRSLPTKKRDGRLPMPGAILKRTHKGHEHHVTVLPNGFEYDGELFRSLSAVAYKITGSQWNGYHFFGLVKETA